MFRVGPDASPRDAVHVLLAGEKVRPEYTSPAPTIDQSEKQDQFSVVNLFSLVVMKLTSFRRKDQVHLLDMLDVGLLDLGSRSFRRSLARDCSS